MKTIIVLLILSVAVSAGAGEESSYVANMDKMAITTTIPINSPSFGNGTERGTLTWEEGVFKFSGNPDGSAQVFLDWMQHHYNDRAEMYCPKNAEIISILERAKALYEHQDAMQFCTQPRNTLDYRPCPEPLERDYEYKLFKDIEAMIKRLK